MRWMLGWFNSQPWFWAWMVAGLVSLAAFLHLPHPGDLSLTAMASPSNAVCRKEQGQFSGPCDQLTHTPTTRARSAVLTRHGAVSVLPPGCYRKHTRGSLSSALLLSHCQGATTKVRSSAPVGCRAHSPVCCSW